MDSHRTAGPPNRPHAERACRLCGRPLSALQRVRGDVCDGLDCRRRATNQWRKDERETALAATAQRAADDRGEPALRTAPVVWLQDHDTRLVAPTAAELDAQHAYLTGLEEAATGPDPGVEADADAPPDNTAAGAEIGHRLCAFCSGRCCRTGGQHNAFIRADLVRRWLLRHAGGTWSDAVADYLRHLPARHVDGSCLHHGERGCTLPREMRSDICNEYACDPLLLVRQRAARDPALRVVAAVVKGHALRDAAIVDAGGIRVLDDGAD